MTNVSAMLQNLILQISINKFNSEVPIKQKTLTKYSKKAVYTGKINSSNNDLFFYESDSTRVLWVHTPSRREGYGGDQGEDKGCSLLTELGSKPV